jgi:hypothetical protein
MTFKNQRKASLMADQINIFWWGVESCIDEDTTRSLLNVLDAGATTASVVGLFASDPDSKAAITIAGAAVKLGAVAIKAVDQNGGSNGVCISQFWVGSPCWVKSRPQ